MEIQKLPKNFYAKIANYLERIRKERRMLDEKTTKAKLLNREFESVKSMVEDLVHLRYEKVRTMALARESVSKEVLTEEEERFHGEIFSVTVAYQSFLKDLLKGRLSPIKKEEKSKKILLRFVEEIPAIVGSDMKTYGPFEAEDIATLPSENARALIKKGIAVEVEIR